MITLFQPAPAFGLPNASPFCMKLEAFLRWQKIPFEVQLAQPDQGPKKKVPFVEIDNQRIGDSNVIIYRLLESQKINYGDVEFTYGIAFQRVVEDHLYWALVHFRWLDDEVWPFVRDAFFHRVPEAQREAVASQARTQTKNRLDRQGTSRLNDEAICESVRADLSAISQHVSENEYLCGNTMTHFDLAVWSMLSQLLRSTLVTRLTSIAKEFPALENYLKRVDSTIDG